MNGRPHGIVRYTFARSGAVNHAEYNLGTRVNFESRTSAKVLSNLALQFLMDDAAFTNEIESNSGVSNFGQIKRGLSLKPL